MFNTKITNLLKIKYPIIQGGLQWLGKAELASAVSNAGCLGIINALTFETPQKLKEEIRKMYELTDQPFGVNVSMLPILGNEEIYKNYFDTIIEEGVKVVETSGRNPDFIIPTLKKADIKIIHKVPSIRFAKKAESLGVDAVTVVGFECGGHPGMDEVTSLILIRKGAKVLNIPLIAGGGFADGHGLIAALALGADGIVMGTRFLATKECPIHQNFKNWIVKANETDTMIILRSIKNPERVRVNQDAKTVLHLEKEGKTLEELLPIISGKVGKSAYLSGDLEKGIVACGQVIGIIEDIPSVKELIEIIISEAEEVRNKLTTIWE